MKEYKYIVLQFFFIENQEVPFSLFEKTGENNIKVYDKSGSSILTTSNQIDCSDLPTIFKQKGYALVSCYRKQKRSGFIIRATYVPKEKAKKEIKECSLMELFKYFWIVEVYRNPTKDLGNSLSFNFKSKELEHSGSIRGLMPFIFSNK